MFSVDELRKQEKDCDISHTKNKWFEPLLVYSSSDVTCRLLSTLCLFWLMQDWRGFRELMEEERLKITEALEKDEYECSHRTTTVLYYHSYRVSKAWFLAIVMLSVFRVRVCRVLFLSWGCFQEDPLFCVTWLAVRVSFHSISWICFSYISSSFIIFAALQTLLVSFLSVFLFLVGDSCLFLCGAIFLESSSLKKKMKH
jgi:hypothetical protein